MLGLRRSGCGYEERIEYAQASQQGHSTGIPGYRENKNGILLKHAFRDLCRV